MLKHESTTDLYTCIFHLCDSLLHVCVLQYIRGEKLQEETGIPLSTSFTNDSMQQLAQLAQASASFQGFPGLQ